MTRYAGIDDHTANLHVTVLDETGSEVDHFTVTNDGRPSILLDDGGL